MNMNELAAKITRLAYLQGKRVDRALWPAIEKDMKGKAAKVIDNVIAQAREQPA